MLLALLWCVRISDKCSACVFADGCCCRRDQFGKTHFPNPDFSSGPYYVGIVTPVLHYCMGGLDIDDDGHVLSAASNGTRVLRGLYAAGEVVGGIHGNNRLAGNALTECVVFGRIAAATIQHELSATAAHDTATAATATPTPQAAAPAGLRQITRGQLASNDGKSGRPLWTALYGKVYDMTDFAPDHPGGVESIHGVAGVDGTASFSTVHTEAMLQDFEPLGDLVA